MVAPPSAARKQRLFAAFYKEVALAGKSSTCVTSGFDFSASFHIFRCGFIVTLDFGLWTLDYALCLPLSKTSFN
jgi:hypothetical protein